MIRKVISRFSNSEYLKSVATLATGTTFAQGISIITAPILYRIYSKEDYGTLGLYMAIVGIIGVFSTMQYLEPILLEKEDENAKKIMWLNRVINTVISIFVLIVVILFGDYFGNIMDNKEIVPWLYLAPISIFFTGQSQILGIWANRKKKYKILSFNAILTALLVPVVSIGIGLYNNGPLGLFLGLLVSHIIPPFILLVTLTKNDNLGLRYLDWEVIKAKAKEYKSFPIYNLPSEFINRLTNQMPVFMLSAYAGPAVVGIYNLCVRMLGLPIQLIGGALARVFKQKATQDYNDKGDFHAIFMKTLKSLVLLSIIPVVVVLMFGPVIFSLVFGEKWREAGVFSQIFVCMFMLKLIVSPLSYAFFIKNRLNEDMFWHLYMFVSMGAVFWLGFNLTENYKNVLFFYVLNYSLIYVLYLIRSYQFSKPTLQ